MGPWMPPMKGQDGRKTTDQWIRFDPRVETTRPRKMWQPLHV
jgi:hypothetical protein